MSALVGSALLRRTIATNTGVDESVVETVLTAHEMAVTELLELGARVRFLDDGLLVMITTKATVRPNPQTGGLVQVPSRKKIVYRLPKKRKEKL